MWQQAISLIKYAGKRGTGVAPIESSSGLSIKNVIISQRNKRNTANICFVCFVLFFWSRLFLHVDYFHANAYNLTTHS
jgi:hypothetical protein